MDQSAGNDEELFAVTTADAQDILILCSAALSFVKSLMAVGTYSYFHIVFALVELACTGLAFVIFYTEDYRVAERREELYGDDSMLYLLTFISGILIEWMDVLITYQTVRAYKRLKKTRSRRIIEETKQKASNTYKCMLIMGIILSAIVPLIAFSKARWETDHFAPSEFASENGSLLLVSVIMTLISQGIMTLVATLNATNPEGLIKFANNLGKVLNCVNLVPSILIYVVLARVSRGQEAGALTYIAMINSIQGVESMCEIARHMVWFQLEHPDAVENPCGEVNAVVRTVEDVLLQHFQSADDRNTGFLPLATVVTKLEELEEAGLLKSGAAAAVLSLEKIDYREIVKTIQAAGVVEEDAEVPTSTNDEHEP